MKKFKVLGLVMASALALGFVSCGDNNDIDGSASIELSAENSILVDKYIDHDPTASYPLTVSVKNSGDGNLIVEGGVNYPVSGSGLATSMQCGTSAAIVDYGKVGGLKNITSIPEEFDGAQTLLQTGHGYVVKAWGTANVNSYGNTAIHDPAPLYIRLYVGKEVKGQPGVYTVYYQYPFEEE